MLRGPFLGGGQPHAPVQRAAITLERLPLLGVVGELPLHAQSLTILLDPAPHGRPRGDERLVGQVDRAGLAFLLVAAQGQQALAGQVHEGLVEQLRILGRGPQRRHRLLAACVVPTLAQLHLTQEDAPGDQPLGGRERCQRGVGPGRERNSQAAAPVHAEHVVGGAGEQPVPALLPQQHHGLLDQRQGAGLVRGVGEQPLDQAWFQLDPDVERRLLDGPPQRRAPQRRDLDPFDRVHRPQLAGHELRIEVRPHRGDDGASVDLVQGEQRRQEARPVGRGRLREDLLQLVHHEQEPLGGVLSLEQLGDRPLQVCSGREGGGFLVPVARARKRVGQGP